MLKADNIPTTIISLENGSNCGVVKEVLLNPKKKCIDSFIVDKARDKNLSNQETMYILPFSSLRGIGDYAIVIQSEDDIVLKQEGFEQQEIYRNKSKLLDTIAISIVGNKIGRVSNYSLDQEGELVSVFVNGEEGDLLREVDAKELISFGNEFSIIDDPGKSQNFSQGFESKSAGFSNEEDLPSSKIERPVSYAQTEDEISARTFAHEKPVAAYDDNTIQKLIEKQKKHLIGKALIKDITDSKGNVFLKRGTVITEEIFEWTKQHRKEVMIELAMFAE